MNTISLPLLKMVAHTVEPKLWQDPFSDSHTAWIFTSKNAVLYCPFTDKPIGPVFAMGSSTATTLEKTGFKLAAIPETPFNSEALVNQLKNVDAKSAVVVTGIGGRTYLANELHSMDWRVTEIACYERLAEIHDENEILTAVSKSDILSLTSIESMDVLVENSKTLSEEWKTKPIIVNSERAINAARKAGFTGEIVVAIPAGDDGQIVALKSLLKNR